MSAWWPPLYPALLAIFGGFAFDARSVAGPFNALAFGLTIFFTGHWLRASVRSRLLIVLGCALVTFSTPVAWMASWALSEAVFIPLTVLALLSAYKFLRSGERSSLIWAAVFSTLGLSDALFRRRPGTHYNPVDGPAALHRAPRKAEAHRCVLSDQHRPPSPVGAAQLPCHGNVHRPSGRGRRPSRQGHRPQAQRHGGVEPSCGRPAGTDSTSRAHAGVDRWRRGDGRWSACAGNSGRLVCPAVVER